MTFSEHRIEPNEPVKSNPSGINALRQAVRNINVNEKEINNGEKRKFISPTNSEDFEKLCQLWLEQQPMEEVASYFVSWMARGAYAALNRENECGGGSLFADVLARMAMRELSANNDGIRTPEQRRLLVVAHNVAIIDCHYRINHGIAPSSAELFIASWPSKKQNDNK